MLDLSTLVQEFEGVKRTLGVANKLENKTYSKKYRSNIMCIINTLRAEINRLTK